MLSRLVLTDFRNYPQAAITAGPGFVVLTGDNGAGKTNVLEAVSLLAPGRGLRRAPLSAMARQGGAGGFGVAATLGDGGIAIGTGTLPPSPERRIVRINGATAPATALAERVSILWLTPAMDRLFVEPAGERRRFLDRLTLALHPTHAHHAARYDAAMRARNRLLMEERAPDADWLAALEAAMADHGTAIDLSRRDTVARLGEQLTDAQSGFARAAIDIEGEATDDLARILAASRRRDAAAGRALYGPHRSDLSVTHLDKAQPAALCSTGEQKALLFAVVLAHAALVARIAGRAPILLLDEVAAHLDPGRRAAVFESLAGLGQVWMTGTEPGLFNDVPTPVHRLHVDDGEIVES